MNLFYSPHGPTNKHSIIKDATPARIRVKYTLKGNVSPIFKGGCGRYVMLMCIPTVCMNVNSVRCSPACSLNLTNFANSKLI